MLIPKGKNQNYEDLLKSKINNKIKRQFHMKVSKIHTNTMRQKEAKTMIKSSISWDIEMISGEQNWGQR